MKAYYENNLVADGEREWTYNGNHYREIIFSMNGEPVGRATFGRDRSKDEKAWEAEVFVNYNAKESYHRTYGVGWRDTLAGAKKAIFDYVKKEAKNTPVPYLPSEDREFYPTPENVAGKLFADVDWKKVKSILEPSAGKGDLIELAKKVNLYGNGRRNIYGRINTRVGDENLDIDCIEIDENLRHILNGKGYRVVHDDFLTFGTKKAYDLILMNPPFSCGDLHLLHAIHLCENGGQIACILNAETIRNPYTKIRATLVKELRRLNANIRYLKGGFKGAERKTDVDVALININIPFSYADTSIFEKMKKAEEHKDENVISADSQLAPSNNIERLIREYNLLCSYGIELIKTYNGACPYITIGNDRYSTPIINLRIGGHDVHGTCGTAEINSYLREVRSASWERLFDLPELKNRMTADMYSEYQSTISEMKDYEFSEFNILQVLERIQNQLGEAAEDAIMKCFDKLSNKHAYNENIENENIHYFNGWKTNKAHYVNNKCIIPTWGCFATEWKSDKYGRYKDVMTELDPEGCFRTLDDLEKALNYIDKGETTPCNLYTSLKVAAINGKTTVQCKYFDVKFYKKGTCHIKFREQKILDRLNIFAARNRMWLPPTYGKVRYKDMESEDRRVVDEFMGKEKYDKLMENPKDYIIEGVKVPLLA